MFSTLIATNTTFDFPHTSTITSNTVTSRLTSAVITTATNDDQSNPCPSTCSDDYCLQYASINKTCTNFIRDQCNCCTICLRTENQTCGGLLNLHGVCERDFLCYQMNDTGICVRACLKYQCINVSKSSHGSTCECAYRRIPCDSHLHDNQTLSTCHNEHIGEVNLLKSNDDVHSLINCSSIICPSESNQSSICPPDSHFVEDLTTVISSSTSLSSLNSTSLCCSRRGHCVCSSCRKTFCGENSILQIYRTGDPSQPGQCCDKFNCIKNSKQCHHEKKIYNENETWSIDHCTTCTCRAGLVDCEMIQCPVYTHCGYMYKPENECCPKCGGCLNDRLHVQHMNSTWLESNGCMRCWCENGRSRCIAEGCIAPPCENPRQIANVCCPVCDDIELTNNSLMKIDSSQSKTNEQCPLLEKCSLVCEYGLARDEQGCYQCSCASMSCPTPLCVLKIDQSMKSYCSCQTPQCGPFACDKHCPYNYSIDRKTGCPKCECNPCPTLICTKNCTYGMKRNDIGCPICVCESAEKQRITTISPDFLPQTRSRQCQSGAFSYSNGEIWFDGCRQCLCHKGEQLCALISCPKPKCAQPVMLPNRCCPSCPDVLLLPEPIPSSQVCYASQYVTGEELEFDKCTKCQCLHNIAFCSISLCPPLRCSSPVYDSLLCCPICPPKSDDLPSNSLSTTDDDVCLLENGVIKHAGELWKKDDCQSCLCPRGGNGQIECFSQTCDQHLSCSNPVLKKGQCCPFCLPPTAAIAVCIFNYIQYRSGEHWNVSDCHHCECSLGTIVCHQRQCPALTCVHTVTLSGHCCPICRDQLSLISDQGKPIVSQSRFGLTVIIIFSIFILILIMVIIVLILILIRGGHRSLASIDQLPTNHHRSPILSPHPTIISSKPSTMYSYVKYDLISISADNHPSKATLSLSSQMPSTCAEQTSTHSIIGTNTTTTTGTHSSHHELEQTTWTEDDAMLPCSISTSNVDEDDDVVVDDIISTDNDESHRSTSQVSQTPVPIITTPPTIIYV